MGGEDKRQNGDAKIQWVGRGGAWLVARFCLVFALQ